MVGRKVRDIVLEMRVQCYFDENCKILDDKFVKL